MRKIFLIAVLFLQIGVCFGQSIGQIYNIPENGDWGEWQKHKGYSKLSFRFRINPNVKDWNKQLQPFTFLNFEIKSEYEYQVNFNLIYRATQQKLTEAVKFGMDYNDPFYVSNGGLNLHNLYSSIDAFGYRKIKDENGDHSSGGITLVGLDLKSFYFTLTFVNKIKGNYQDNMPYLKTENGSLCEFCKYDESLLKALKSANPSKHDFENYKYYCGENYSQMTNSTYSSVQNNSTPQPQNKQEQLQQGITQLADGITGLAAAIKADRERKKQEALLAAQNAELEKQRQATELANKLSEAENGNMEAQIELGNKYYNDWDFNKAEEYYTKALENKSFDEAKSSALTYKLMSVYSLNGKRVKLWNLTEKYDYIKNGFIKQMLKLENYKFGFPTQSDEEIKQAVQKLMKISKYDEDAKATIAYYQIIGRLNDLGIPYNENEGLTTLKNSTYFKKESDFYRTNALAFYYLGLLYCGEGTETIKPNKKEALKYFMYAIQKEDYTLKEKKDLIYIPAISRLNNVSYFNGSLQAYIKVAEILSESNSKKDKEIVEYMIQKFKRRYGNLVPKESLQFFGITEKQNPFNLFNNSISEVTSNNPLTLTPTTMNSIFSKSDKPTLFVTWSKSWCNPCLKDIDKILELKLDKVYNVVLINVDMKNNNTNGVEINEWIIKNKPNYFNNFKILIDGDNILSEYDNESAPYYLLIDKQGNVKYTYLGYGNVQNIKSK